jgi:GTPase SAR1 family protein
MSDIVIIGALSALVAASGAGAAALGVINSATKKKLKQVEEQLRAAAGTVSATQAQLTQARQQIGTMQVAQAQLSAALAKAQEESKQKENWLDNQQQDIDFLRAELEKRPKIVRKTYKILTLGMKATGKTSLTLKWANCLTDLGAIQGTKIERYERTVSQVIGKDATTEHVFEIGDWGGEHIVDAQHELITEEIHGLLIVVDLGGKDAKVVQPERVQEQLREFQPQSLKYFFGAKTVSSCKAVVLFINKADLIPGPPAEAEAQAKKLYAKLIDDLMQHQDKVDIRVLVGSASYGHATHHLFSHFVEKILPKNAYDNQLLQRMKSDLAASAPQAPKPRSPVALR